MNLFHIVMGLFLAGWALYSVWIGQFGLKHGTIDMAEHPGYFWIAVIGVGAWGVKMLLDGIARKEDD